MSGLTSGGDGIRREWGPACPQSSQSQTLRVAGQMTRHTQTDTQTDGQTDRETDGQTDRSSVVNTELNWKLYHICHKLIHLIDAIHLKTYECLC